MKNFKLKVCLLFVLTMLLVSCGSTKPTVVQNNTDHSIVTTETVHDTIFKIEKDSSYYQALLDCQDGKVVIKNVIQSEPGRNLNSPKVRLDNNKLEVDCNAKAQELFAQWKSTYIKEFKGEKVEVPIIINQLTWWQETQIKLFWLFAVIILVWTIWQFIKPKFL